MRKQFGAKIIYVDEFSWNDNGADLTEPILTYIRTDEVSQWLEAYKTVDNSDALALILVELFGKKGA